CSREAARAAPDNDNIVLSQVIAWCHWLLSRMSIRMIIRKMIETRHSLISDRRYTVRNGTSEIITSVNNNARKNRTISLATRSIAAPERLFTRQGQFPTRGVTSAIRQAQAR